MYDVTFILQVGFQFSPFAFKGIVASDLSTYKLVKTSSNLQANNNVCSLFLPSYTLVHDGSTPLMQAFQDGWQKCLGVENN